MPNEISSRCVGDKAHIGVRSDADKGLAHLDLGAAVVVGEDAVAGSETGDWARPGPSRRSLLLDGDCAGDRREPACLGGWVILGGEGSRSERQREAAAAVASSSLRVKARAEISCIGSVPFVRYSSVSRLVDADSRGGGAPGSVAVIVAISRGGADCRGLATCKTLHAGY